jgi:hypothetical protein
VIQAVVGLNKIRREELHDFERPVSYLAFQNAEMNRDKKKRSKPFKPDEFYWYDDQRMQALPEPRYGAAAMKLVEMEQFPYWALFAYRDLKVRAKDALAPEVLAYACDDAIVLAPSIEGRAVTGMLIAMRSASGALREMKSPCGRAMTLRLPPFEAEYYADEEAELSVLN